MKEMIFEREHLFYAVEKIFSAATTPGVSQYPETGGLS
jgi:hypothetical protein